MFTNISWNDYLMGVSIIVVIYYFIIGFRYYSVELKELFSGRGNLRFNNQIADREEDNLMKLSSGQDNRDYPYEHTGDEEFAEVEGLIARLKETIQNIAAKKYDPQEFKHFLRLLLLEYPTVKTSLFRSSVNEFIVSECDKYGSLKLTEQEVELLWHEATS